jgi:hypothetical protein
MNVMKNYNQIPPSSLYEKEKFLLFFEKGCQAKRIA